MDKKAKVHFMGIGGSGMAPIAILAKNMGFEVSGCDISLSGYYSDALIKNKIPVQEGHDLKHLENIDILAVTPAIFDINPDNPEIIEGRKRNILMTWQEFAGKFLHQDKFLISVAGTHGKSTTTILMGLVLEASGLDPIVEAGATYKPWGGGFRVSNSNYFVCEADEFNCNFLNFSPSLAIINNIEMDHPEFFNSFNQVRQAFISFIKRLKQPKILVVNEESLELMKVLQEIKDWLTEERVKLIGYYIDKKYDFPFHTEYKGEIVSIGPGNSVFNVDSPNLHEQFVLNVPGIHNVLNSLGVFGSACELGIDITRIKSAFKEFKGIGRRIEFIGEKNGVRVFDDYAHHPTEIATVLDTLRMGFKDQKIWAIIEPHQPSRIKLFINEFSEALKKADQVIVTKVFLGREVHKNTEPFDIESFLDKIDRRKATYHDSFTETSKYFVSNAKPGDVVVVFGAGNSYKLARNIIENL